MEQHRKRNLLSLNMIQQPTAVDFLEDQKELVMLFKILYQLDDISMALTMVTQIYFLKHSSSTITRNFLYYLNSIFNFRVLIDASLN